MDKDNIDKVRKNQEIAKISKNIYDIQNFVSNDLVDFSTLSTNLQASGLKEYRSREDLTKDLKSMAKSLDNGELSLSELKEYSKFTGTLTRLLESSGSQLSTTYSSETSQSSAKSNGRKVVTLAEVNSYSIDSIEDFKLPQESILLSELNIIDSLYYYNQGLFTGTAYSMFENRQIGEFKTIKEGRLSGPAYSWYQDGSYAMQANFVDGYLAGRFIAWSEVGDLIYDIYFDKGRFQSDLQYERDTTREQQEMDSSDGDADSQQNSGE